MAKPSTPVGGFEPSERKSFMQRHLIWPKLIYFWLSMAIYTCNGLAGPDMKRNWGMSNSSIGYMLSLQGVNFIGAIFWTGLADKTGKHRNLVMIATVVSAFFFLLNALPKLVDYTFAKTHYEMLYMMLVMVSFWFFQSALFPLIDSAMIGMLSQDPSFTKDQFGYQRLWGSPAHSAASIVQGMTEWAPTQFQQRLAYRMVALLASLVLTTLVLLGIPNVSLKVPKAFAHHGAKPKDAPNRLSQATALPLAPSPVLPAAPELDLESTKTERSPVVRLLTDPGFLFFMLFVLSAGLLSNTMTLFQPLMMTDTMKKTGFEAALTRMPASASEIVVYLFSKEMMHTFGVYWLLLISQVFGIIRMVGYAYLDARTSSPVWPYLLEITKGLNSSFIMSAGIRVASDIALPGCSTSAQGLFSGTYKGVAITITGLVAGALLRFVMDENLQTLFKWVACFALLTTISFFLKFLLVDGVIGVPGFPRRAKASTLTTHSNPSTSSFGSVAPSQADIRQQPPSSPLGKV